MSIGKELTRYDAFAKQVENAFDALLGNVTARKEAALQDIQRKRTQLAVQLGEIQTIIERKRYEESAEIETALDEYIVTGYETKANYDVKLFSGTMELQRVGEILENSVSVEMLLSLLEQKMSWDIPVLKGNSLRLFNRKTLQMAQMVLSQTTRIDGTTAYCYIGWTTLLAVGGRWHNEAYEVNIRSGEIEKVANMTVSRGCVGIINYKECVYVIGGYTGSQYLNTGEKYGITSKSWTSLSHPMQKAKCCCSVCEHTSGLYISGVDGSGSSIEHFNPLTETFRLLRADSIDYASILSVWERSYIISDRLK